MTNDDPVNDVLYELTLSGLLSGTSAVQRGLLDTTSQFSWSQATVSFANGLDGPDSEINGSGHAAINSPFIDIRSGSGTNYYTVEVFQINKVVASVSGRVSHRSFRGRLGLKSCIGIEPALSIIWWTCRPCGGWDNS